MVEFVQFHVHFQIVVLLEHNNFFAFVEVETKKSKVIYLLLKHDSWKSIVQILSTFDSICTVFDIVPGIYRDLCVVYIQTQNLFCNGGKH